MLVTNELDNSLIPDDCIADVLLYIGRVGLVAESGVNADAYDAVYLMSPCSDQSIR